MSKSGVGRQSAFCACSERKESSARPVLKTSREPLRAASCSQNCLKACVAAANHRSTISVPSCCDVIHHQAGPCLSTAAMAPWKTRSNVLNSSKCGTHLQTRCQIHRPQIIVRPAFDHESREMPTCQDHIFAIKHNQSGAHSLNHASNHPAQAVIEEACLAAPGSSNKQLTGILERNRLLECSAEQTDELARDDLTSIVTNQSVVQVADDQAAPAWHCTGNAILKHEGSAAFQCVIDTCMGSLPSSPRCHNRRWSAQSAGLQAGAVLSYKPEPCTCNPDR